MTLPNLVFWAGVASFVLILLIVIFKLRSSGVKDRVPIEYIDYENAIVIYKRDTDGRYYQRVGIEVQIKVAKLNDQTVHRIDGPFKIDPTELVEIVYVKPVSLA